MLPSLLTIKETCELLHCNPSTLRQWGKIDLLPAVQYGKRNIRRYRKEDVQRLLEKRTKIEHIQNLQFNDYCTEELTTVNDRIMKMHSIANALLEKVSTYEVATTFLKESLPALHADMGLIYFPTEEIDMLKIFSSVKGKKSDIHRWEYLPVGAPFFITETYLNGKFTYISNAENSDNLLSKSFLSSMQLQTATAIPLLNKGKKYGIIVFGYKSNKHFSESERKFLESLGELGVQSLEKAELIEREQQFGILLEKINSSVLKFFKPSEVHDTLQIIVQEARSLFQIKYGSILTEHDGKLERAYANTQVIAKSPVRIGGRTYSSLRTKAPTVVYINKKDQIHPEQYKLGIKSIIFIPLIYSNITVGVLNLFSLKREHFSKKMLELLQLYGAFASLAIQKAKLYSETKLALDNNNLYIALAAHEIRTPLTAVSSYAQLMERSIANRQGISDALIINLTDEVKRLTLMINEFLGHAGNRSLIISKKMSNLKHITQRALVGSQILYPNHKFIFRNLLTDDDGEIYGDYDKLMQVIINITNNAAKFSPENTEIKVSLKNSGNKYTLEIADLGKGIKKSEIRNIFTKFYTKDAGKGMGLGLYLAKQIIEAHSGEIHVNSQVGKGTTFIIQLPKLNGERTETQNGPN